MGSISIQITECLFTWMTVYICLEKNIFARYQVTLSSTKGFLWVNAQYTRWRGITWVNTFWGDSGIIRGGAQIFSTWCMTWKCIRSLIGDDGGRGAAFSFNVPLLLSSLFLNISLFIYFFLFQHLIGGARVPRFPLNIIRHETDVKGSKSMGDNISFHNLMGVCIELANLLYTIKTFCEILSQNPYNCSIEFEGLFPRSLYD